jgi:hypothetical protein
MKERSLYYAILSLVSVHFASAYIVELPFYGGDYADIALGINQEGPPLTRPLMSLVLKGALHWKFLASISRKLPAPYSSPLTFFMFAVLAICIFVSTDFVRRAARSLQVQAQIAYWGSFLVPLMAYFNYILVSEVRFQSSYDVVQMAVFSLCLWAMLVRNRWVFYVVLLIGTMNKESTCFLVPMFGILEWKRIQVEGGSYSRLMAELIFQTSIWLPLRYYSAHILVAHPTMTTWHWARNLHYLLSPFHWMTTLSMFAFLWILYAAQLKRIDHPGLRYCALLLIPWAVLMFGVGDLLEIRIHGEWTSYFALCLILITANFLNAPLPYTRH